MKLKDLKLHKVTDIFPAPQKDELDRLTKSIKKYGVLVPLVIVDHKYIIDGKQRAIVAATLGIEEVPIVELHIGKNDIIACVFEFNINRRVLNPGQKALLVLENIDSLDINQEDI